MRPKSCNYSNNENWGDGLTRADRALSKIVRRSVHLILQHFCLKKDENRGDRTKLSNIIELTIASFADQRSSIWTSVTLLIVVIRNTHRASRALGLMIYTNVLWMKKNQLSMSDRPLGKFRWAVIFSLNFNLFSTYILFDVIFREKATVPRNFPKSYTGLRHMMFSLFSPITHWYRSFGSTIVTLGE